MDECLHWLIQNLDNVPEQGIWLGKHEKDVLSGLRFLKRRNDWRLGRWTAKQACCRYQPGLQLSMPEIDIITAEDGGPDIYVGGKPAPVSISISHSHGRGFCVVAPDHLAVGCDLEWIEYQSPEFFDDYFLPEETSFCRKAPEALKPIAGYLIWSAKESCLKILREGLRRDTRSVRIDVDSKAAESSWNTWVGHCMETSRIFYGWWRYDHRFIYTLASDRPNQAPVKL